VSKYDTLKILVEFYEFAFFTFCKNSFASSIFLGNKTLSLSFDATKDKSVEYDLPISDFVESSLIESVNNE
jgi:hypothetical protein